MGEAEFWKTVLMWGFIILAGLMVLGWISMALEYVLLYTFIALIFGVIGAPFWYLGWQTTAIIVWVIGVAAQIYYSFIYEDDERNPSG